MLSYERKFCEVGVGRALVCVLVLLSSYNLHVITCAFSVFRLVVGRISIELPLVDINLTAYEIRLYTYLWLSWGKS